MTVDATQARWICSRYAAACATLCIAFAAHAAEPVSAASQLATVQRQLNTIDRLATQAEQFPESDRPRYHFDYARLHADIARIRAGVRDYLAPPRAQPRDGADLVGDYRVDVSSEERP
ncbi:type III effector Hop protein [Burkholderia sp. Bp9012]|uniref:integrative conjugative element protein, RAQPRD family n=1 Tax=Burkholderia sp. Bp9012 TaxID=2184562 RepID=UPI000F5937B5|nr:RAQPRD family integrative conjugative element protein [Burkholderia sp. Bp9012]RQR79155.1 type III effector Hop protein [Burkholderia sp. Bp9012]